MLRKFLYLIILLMLVTSCKEKNFISDPDYMSKVEQRFQERVKYSSNRADKLFNVFDDKLSLEEEQALKFLYAYMPLNDLADYSGKYFLKQVRASFDAKNTFKWGKKIPGEIFRHFVLPYRVNNENLDSARSVFLRELKPRLINMDLKEAILEVNHWCHEKVTYKGTDIRTSGPLSLVRTSWGRCGEESTFTVTALRSVGIPARQVYTPRWAHCDDNHAWVEVWVDGSWYFLGACEPEGDLNIAWFTEPAKRAMMVHTKVFGDYDSDEEIIEKTENYTKINTLKYYSKVKKIFVRVSDSNNSPIKNANVEFGLYNYAEFYPIASKFTNQSGLVSITTGFGDLMLSANFEGLHNSKKISVELADTIDIVLNKSSETKTKIDVDINPPIIKDVTKVDEITKSENQIRFAQEDKIRNDYMGTFISETEAGNFANEINLNPKRVWNLLDKSEGNWKNIKNFIAEAVKEGQSEIKIFGLLENINEKDLRDTEKIILDDHLYNSIKLKSVKNDFYNKYVLNPRIKNEMIVPYKKLFKSKYEKLKEDYTEETVLNIKLMIQKNISIDEDQNYYDLPITPVGVDELKISNKESRDIYFVAICRSLGIPARLEEAEKIPQYFDGVKWVKVHFEKRETKEYNPGFLSLILNKTNVKFDPLYYIHFTIGKLENGKYKTLDYEWQKNLKDFPKKIALEPGKYRIITGNRRENGSVLTNITYFDIDAGNITKVNVELRKDPTPLKVLGEIDITKKINGNVSLTELLTKNYLILGWLDPDKEPTKHFFVDLQTLKAEYEKWGGNVSLMVPKDKQTKSFNDEFKTSLPKNIFYPENENFELLNTVIDELKIKKEIDYPLILIVDSEGQIIFSSSGYRIGLGEQLLKIIL